MRKGAEIAFISQNSVRLLAMAWEGYLTSGRGAVMAALISVPIKTPVYMSLPELRGLAHDTGNPPDSWQPVIDYDPEKEAVVFLLVGPAEQHMRRFGRTDMTPKEAHAQVLREQHSDS